MESIKFVCLCFLLCLGIEFSRLMAHYKCLLLSVAKKRAAKLSHLVLVSVERTGKKKLNMFTFHCLIPSLGIKDFLKCPCCKQKISQTSIYHQKKFGNGGHTPIPSKDAKTNSSKQHFYDILIALPLELWTSTVGSVSSVEGV